MIRPGRLVELVNLSSGGACVRGAARLLPGRRAELQLTGGGGRRTMTGLVVRCAVCGLEPLEYEGAIRFDAEQPDLLSIGGSG
ncbi:MAG: PilZ domain-containing protein [Vicinamibacterales bacterium]